MCRQKAKSGIRLRGENFHLETGQLWYDLWKRTRPSLHSWIKVYEVHKLLFFLKSWLFTWTHELTKHRRKAWHPCLHFVPVVLYSESFSSAATLKSRKNKNDRWPLYDKGLKLLRNSRTLQDRPPLQRRTIIYNNEAAVWTRLFPSGNDSDNNFLQNPWRPRTEIMTNQGILVTGTA
jgi:hypothetical protein